MIFWLHAQRQSQIAGLPCRARDQGLPDRSSRCLGAARSQSVFGRGRNGGPSGGVGIRQVDTGEHPGGLDLPSSGRVFFRDQDLSRASDRQLTAFRRDHVGFVFQFYNLVPSLTASENVALVTEIAKNPMTPQEALERVGLAHRMDHFPAEL